MCVARRVESVPKRNARGGRRTGNMKKNLLRAFWLPFVCGSLACSAAPVDEGSQQDELAVDEPPNADVVDGAETATVLGTAAAPLSADAGADGGR